VIRMGRLDEQPPGGRMNATQETAIGQATRLAFRSRPEGGP